MVRCAINSDLYSKKHSYTDFEVLANTRGYFVTFFSNKCALQTENVCSFTSKLPIHIERWCCADFLRVHAEKLPVEEKRYSAVQESTGVQQKRKVRQRVESREGEGRSSGQRGTSNRGSSAAEVLSSVAQKVEVILTWGRSDSVRKRARGSAFRLEILHVYMRKCV